MKATIPVCAKSFAPLLRSLGLAMLALLPELGGGGVRAQAQTTGPPAAVSDTEKLILEAHRLIHRLRGDHEHVHDSAGNQTAMVVAQKVLHDASAPMLARLDHVPTTELIGFSEVWQMLYYQARTALEFYLACGSQTPEVRAEKARAAVADGERAIELLDRILARNDPADVWLLEDKKKETIRWYQAAAEGLNFHATRNPSSKNAAITLWESLDKDFRQLYPPDSSSHLVGVVPGNTVTAEDRSVWPLLVGVGFALMAALFFMVLVIKSVSGKDVSPQARPILVFFFALCCAMASAFIAGSLHLRGEIPFFDDNPLAVGASGGLAVLLLVIIVGNRAWKPHGGVAQSGPVIGGGVQETPAMAGMVDTASKANPVAEGLKED